MDEPPPQPTVLLTGGGDQLRSVATALFDERAAGTDGAVVVTTRRSPTAMVRRVTGESGRFERGRLAVVDARDTDAQDGEVDDVTPGSDGDTLGVGHRERLDPRADPETVDGAVTTGLEWLAGAGVERRHVLYDTLATSYRAPDESDAYDRAYRVAMTVGSEDGLALFTLDDGGREPAVVERLGHLFDVHVELREVDGTTELRWTGLLGASDGWIARTDAEFGDGGFR